LQAHHKCLINNYFVHPLILLLNFSYCIPRSVALTCHLSSLLCTLSQWARCTLPGLPFCPVRNENGKKSKLHVPNMIWTRGNVEPTSMANLGPLYPCSQGTRLKCVLIRGCPHIRGLIISVFPRDLMGDHSFVFDIFH